MGNPIAPQHDDTTFEQLEFHKIVEKLKGFLKTPYGEERLSSIHPCCDPAIVQNQLEEVTEMVGLLQAEYGMPLGGLSEIRLYLEKIKPENAFLEASELLEVKSTLQVLGELSRFFREHRQQAPRLYFYAQGIHSYPKIVREINATIDPGGEVRDSASPELRQIRNQIRALEGEQQKLLQRLLKRYSKYSQDEIITLRDGRMVLGIQHQWIKKVNGIVHGTSHSGATVFVEPMEVLQLSNQIQNLKVEEHTEIIKILRFLTDLIRQVRIDIDYGLENVAILDVIHAKAQLARELRATMPKITSVPRMKLVQARHPLLILKMGHHNVVPLSLELGRDFRTLVITGPNAGGKTVALKTIGLLLLMPQFGLLVPAEEDSEIPLLPRILVDIGDRQSIEQDLSTFSAHIVRLREIVSRAGKQSLILLDEIGTGTDPKEGAALAIAILFHLTRKRILTVATTHHGELKAFAHATEKVENASMEFDLETLQPTYRLRTGVPGSSYAFEIARRYGLPEPIIQTAQSSVGKDKETLEGLILRLEKRLQELDKERRELSVKLTQAEGLQGLYERQLEQLKERKSVLKQEAAQEAQQIIQDSKRLIERLVADIRKSQASREAIKQAQEALREQQHALSEILKEQEPQVSPDVVLRKGDRVWIKSLQEEGELLRNPDARGRVRVLVGNVKLTLKVSDLQKIQHSEEREWIIHHVPGEQVDAIINGVKPELDVRGMDSMDAIEETDRYLNQAIHAGWEEVRIIHGKGTGVLRKRINEFLSRDKRVVEKRLGKWGEGDTGVTVVKLKTNDS